MLREPYTQRVWVGDTEYVLTVRAMNENRGSEVSDGVHRLTIHTLLYASPPYYKCGSGSELELVTDTFENLRLRKHFDFGGKMVLNNGTSREDRTRIIETKLRR